MQNLSPYLLAPLGTSSETFDLAQNLLHTIEFLHGQHVLDQL